MSNHRVPLIKKKLALGESSAMSITFPTKILLAIDGSEKTSLAAQTAADLAAKTGSELHVLYVGPGTGPHYPGGYVGPEVMEHYQQREQRIFAREAQSLLEESVQKIEAAGSRVAQVHFRLGKPDRENVAVADELGAGLIVIGSHGWGRLRRALLGEVSEEVICHGQCPVLVVCKEKKE